MQRASRCDPHRVFQKLVGAHRDTFLLRSRESFGTEAGDALREAALHKPVEHAQCVLHLHVFEPLEHLCIRRAWKCERRQGAGGLARLAAGSGRLGTAGGREQVD